ncbi:bifunctional ornithine acetyltransferase/N-acetylglutamate synthase [Virgibacillus halophilus]|uniref:bifunctional ornithine acetyltransferase/N-acetylglutamate synthase n=1 Tax=Tigheibacillus halophilus TaxID=361280 RepID=UPI00363B3A0D
MKTITIKEISGTITSPAGFQAAGIHCGVKRKRNDLGIIYSEIPASAAAVYTKNIIQAAPITVTKESLEQSGNIQAVIVNSGNANACTGKKGLEDARDIRDAVAKHFQVLSNHVAVASTGIIGLPMPMEKIMPAISMLKPSGKKNAAAQFAESVLTTDTFKKKICYQTEIEGKIVTMGGVAKGSGMIEPNMGTMLGFLTTDANITPSELQRALKQAVDGTFNCITVDGDTSTNDMVLALANGLAENDSLSPEHPDWEAFTGLIHHVCEDLAKMIARDGEGATKLISVEVAGAKDDCEARKVAKTVVGSSLVKTAVFGVDANWGRIIAAIGYSGANVNPQTIDAAIGPIKMLEDSQPLPFSEKDAKAYLQKDDIHIAIDLKNGPGQGKAWGCDLTYDYVRINASYRT